jgi:ribosomal protein L16 Arg81 hydroxylase
VFVLQVSGRKRWIVHEPVVRLPLSSQPQAGAHLVPEGAEPLMDVELLAGDALYLPRGYVHAALTTDDDSVHLTVGVLSTTWYDLLRDVLTLAGEREEFRDALPVQPADSLDPLLPGFLRSAADWLESVPLDEVRRLAADRLARSVPVEPLSLLATASAVRSLVASTVCGRDGDSPRRCG